MFAILLIISTLFADSSKTEVGLMGHYGQSTYAIEGDRAGGFSVQAASVHDIDSVSRVFGVASYSWQQSHGNHFVENADYDLLHTEKGFELKIRDVLSESEGQDGEGLR